MQNAAAHAEQAQDPAAQLEGSFRQHARSVIHAAYRITGSVQDAEDVLQTVFLRLAKREAGRPLGQELGGYLHRAAVNAALDLVRARKTVRATSLDEVGPALVDRREPGPDSAHGHRELEEHVRRALAAESPKAAEIFTLRYFEGYDNQEIARLVGTSAGTVAVILHRTRGRLRDAIDPSLGEPT